MIQGAILGMSSIIVRLIGVVYRIPLTNIIGDKGIGYYSVAFDIYQILLLLSSYSLPLAVSKMVSARVALEQHKRVRKIFFSALIFAEIVGFIAFLITRMLSPVHFLLRKVPRFPAQGLPDRFLRRQSFRCRGERFWFRTPRTSQNGLPEGW